MAQFLSIIPEAAWRASQDAYVHLERELASLQPRMPGLDQSSEPRLLAPLPIAPLSEAAETASVCGRFHRVLNEIVWFRCKLELASAPDSIDRRTCDLEAMYLRICELCEQNCGEALRRFEGAIPDPGRHAERVASTASEFAELLDSMGSEWRGPPSLPSDLYTFYKSAICGAGDCIRDLCVGEFREWGQSTRRTTGSGGAESGKVVLFAYEGDSKVQVSGGLCQAGVDGPSPTFVIPLDGTHERRGSRVEQIPNPDDLSESLRAVWNALGDGAFYPAGELGRRVGPEKRPVKANTITWRIGQLNNRGFEIDHTDGKGYSRPDMAAHPR